MKRRGRARRVLKWGGTVACATLVAMLVLSAWCAVQFDTRDAFVRVSDGTVICVMDRSRQGSFARFGVRPPQGWQIDLMDPSAWRQRLGDLYWLPRVEQHTHSMGIWTAVKVPLWTPLAVIALPTAYLWWRDRRIPPGHCQKCGYNLTGNVSGRCPECGTPTMQPSEGRP